MNKPLPFTTLTTKLNALLNSLVPTEIVSFIILLKVIDLLVLIFPTLNAIVGQE